MIFQVMYDKSFAMAGSHAYEVGCLEAESKEQAEAWLKAADPEHRYIVFPVHIKEVAEIIEARKYFDHNVKYPPDMD